MKDETIRVRVDKQTMLAIARAVSQSNSETVSQWLRKLIKDKLTGLKLV